MGIEERTFLEGDMVKIFKEQEGTTQSLTDGIKVEKRSNAQAMLPIPTSDFAILFLPLAV